MCGQEFAPPPAVVTACVALTLRSCCPTVRIASTRTRKDEG